jgi:hypothetical protein
MATDLNQLLINPELAGFERQRRMAELLVQRGQKTPQGQMIGNIYVGASPWEFLGNMAQQYVGEQELKDIDKKELSMAQALRQKEIADLTKFSELQYGTPDQMVQQAGPMMDGGNIAPQMVQGQAPNRMAAYQLGMESRNPLVRSQLAEMLKGQKLSEGDVFQRYNPATGKDEIVGQGPAKYRAPIQIDTGTAIELRDPLDPTKVISKIPKSQMPTAGQIYESAEGPLLINTKAGTATPLMGPDGQPLAAKAKPLPEGLNKQVTGSVNLSDAITDYQAKIKNFSTVDFTNPDKRAEMGNAYNNMMLQAKEAYNLGVLNGPDYAILQKVVRDPTNPSSLLFTNKALDKQAENLRNTAQSIVKNAYMSQGREVPADIAKKLVKPEAPQGGKNFSSEQDVEKAIQNGSLKKGDRVTINGVTGTIQ